MNQHEEFNDRLDTEFDYLLLDMKPYVLKNPNKTGKVKFTVFFGVFIQTSVVDFYYFLYLEYKSE